MAVRLLVPWFDYKPGDTVELGDAVDEKLIRRGEAERIGPPPKKEAAMKPKEARDER